MFGKLGSKAVLRLFVFVAVAFVALAIFGKFLMQATAAAEEPFPTHGGFFVLNFSEPVRQEFKAVLSSFGVKLVYYVPENAYIAKVPGSSLEQIRSLWFIETATRYSQGGKVQWHLKKGLKEAETEVQQPVAEAKEVAREAHS